MLQSTSAPKRTTISVAYCAKIQKLQDAHCSFCCQLMSGRENPIIRKPGDVVQQQDYLERTRSLVEQEEVIAIYL